MLVLIDDRDQVESGSRLPWHSPVAYITRVEHPYEGGTSRLVVDLVRVFHDQAAVDAALADGQPRVRAQVLSTDVRNQNPRLRTLPLASDVHLRSRRWLWGADQPPAGQAGRRRPSDERFGHTFYFTLTVAGGAVQRVQENLAINACWAAIWAAIAMVELTLGPAPLVYRGRVDDRQGRHSWPPLPIRRHSLHQRAILVPRRLCATAPTSGEHARRAEPQQAKRRG